MMMEYPEHVGAWSPKALAGIGLCGKTLEHFTFHLLLHTWEERKLEH